MAENPFCETCRFWDRIAEIDDGLCRVRPPTFDAAAIIGENSRRHMAGLRQSEFERANRGLWPIVRPTDWCGAHQPSARVMIATLKAMAQGET